MSVLLLLAVALVGLCCALGAVVLAALDLWRTWR